MCWREESERVFHFKLNNQKLELVDEFKYLGGYFKYNGYFKNNMKHIKEQATRAMFVLLSKKRKYNLPLDIMLDLFDKTPIILYGCEVWGIENFDLLESVHLKFCKYLLGIKTCIPNCMIYGELGR